jgi:DNA-directed RNA polymerase specialized sigma24 family protein
MPGGALDEIVDDATCAVVMKPRTIRDEEHLRRAFWLSARFLLARYHEGRHRVRVGSRQRADFALLAESIAADGPTVAEAAELKDRLARAADFMAQLDALEARVTSYMAARGIGIKLAARELDLPLNTVKAAAHSAQTKLEQVAAIAAAGRMCDYRQPAIEAHAAQVAEPQQARVAQAHISACPRCRSSYVLLVREMRRRDFQRRASAAFLPLPALMVHPTLLARVASFVGTHMPGDRMPNGLGPRERALAVLGSGGAGAAKAAGLLAGATLVVVGATTGAHDFQRPAKSSARHARPKVHVARIVVPPALGPPTKALKQQSQVHTAIDRRDQRAIRSGFVYLGGNPPAARVAESQPVAGHAASLGYLGGNRGPQSSSATTATANTAPAETSTSKGGQFSP